MKLTAFAVIATLGIATGAIAGLGSSPAHAGDVSVGIGFSVGTTGYYGYPDRRWRRAHRSHRHYRHRGHRRHWHRRHYDAPYVVYYYGYPGGYNESVDYDGAPDYPNVSVNAPTDAKPPESGEYCREYLRDVVIDGKAVQAYGRACRQEDGSWKIVSEGGN